MATNRLESSGPSLDPEPSGGEAAPGPAAPAKGPESGGLKAWLPLIVTVVAMPVLAYATTTFLLAPKLQKALGGGEAVADAGTEEAGGEGGHGDAGDGAGKGGEVKPRAMSSLNKIVVNVAGTLGTRYLVTNIALVSSRPGLDGLVRGREAQLRDLAISCLSSKTINDMEKPGAKNLLRSELIALFNSVLGNGAVQEIYFTEFAIQ